MDTAYVITGPTSGIGHATALDLAAYGTVVLVGRNSGKLDDVRAAIGRKGGRAVSIVCDMADLASVRRAAEQILALPYTVAGVLNNAGVMRPQTTKSVDGFDMTFATNYLGPFALTDALTPHLPDGANLVYISSAIEDPDRRPAQVMGMRGGQFISVGASAEGQWRAGGSKMPGIDAYATSKQCILAAAMGFARENPRLRFNTVEPGITPGTGLGGVNNPLLVFLFSQVITRLPPFSRYRSTPKRSARTITQVLTDSSDKTGVYFDEKGKPMHGSALAHDPSFQHRLLAETREFLASRS